MIGEFAKERDCDLIVIPCSIHELILIPRNHKIPIKELYKTVYEINRTELEEEDFLSDNVYLYSLEDGELRILEEDE